MSTKEQVLALLKESGDAFLSGQEIAGRLQISRSAVWKAVRTLQEEGQGIEAVTNRGYRLVEELPKPDAGRIRAYLERSPAAAAEPEIWPEICVYDTVDSTNNVAMQIADPETKREKVIIAGMQTAGKGRRGRSFFSPGRTGLYMSFLLYPQMDFTQATRLTCMMAEAVCRAIRAETGLETQIKWVNDVYYQGKKIVGILTEGRTSMEDGSLAFVVIGTGLNLFPPREGFPKDLRAPAGALLDAAPDAATINRMYAAIIEQFFALYRNPDRNAFLEGYRARSLLIGQRVQIHRFGGNEKQPDGETALVTGIDENCRLLVKYDDGKTEALSGGEVSAAKF